MNANKSLAATKIVTRPLNQCFHWLSYELTRRFWWDKNGPSNLIGPSLGTDGSPARQAICSRGTLLPWPSTPPNWRATPASNTQAAWALIQYKYYLVYSWYLSSGCIGLVGAPHCLSVPYQVKLDHILEFASLTEAAPPRHAQCQHASSPAAGVSLFDVKGEGGRALSILILRTYYRYWLISLSAAD